MSHRSKEAVQTHEVSHITMKLQAELPSLRQSREYALLLEAFRKGKDRFGLRLVLFSVQRDHQHLAVEAESRGSIRRGMIGLTVRIASALNKLWNRNGKVFRDRFHERVERRVQAIRKLLIFVLHNHTKHEPKPIGRKQDDVDTYCSGWWLPQWRALHPAYLSRFDRPQLEHPVVQPHMIRRPSPEPSRPRPSPRRSTRHKRQQPTPSTHSPCTSAASSAADPEPEAEQSNGRDLSSRS